MTPSVVTDPTDVDRSVREVRADGDQALLRHGLEGWSAMQFIETSIAATIAVEHFGGTPTVTVLQR